jgi:hypothetical protein
VRPGLFVGTIRIEMPACFFESGSVRAASQMCVDTSASDVQIFWPWITHSSPSRTARVRSDARSVPAFGSL